MFHIIALILLQTTKICHFQSIFIRPKIDSVRTGIRGSTKPYIINIAEKINNPPEKKENVKIFSVLVKLERIRNIN